MTEEQRYDKSGRSLQERIHYWRDIMDAKSGWANDVSGPCCDKCRMTKPKDPLQALVGCRDPFQINCQCHIPYREAVRKLIIRELEAVDTTPLPESQPLSGATPRVDALIDSKPSQWKLWNGMDFSDLRNLARQLERELADITSKAEKWAKQRDKFADRLEGAAPVSTTGERK